MPIARTFITLTAGARSAGPAAESAASCATGAGLLQAASTTTPATSMDRPRAVLRATAATARLPVPRNTNADMTRLGQERETRFMVPPKRDTVIDDHGFRN
jgi:hypothetical protein